jgi:hypothetical protein
VIPEAEWERAWTVVLDFGCHPEAVSVETVRHLEIKIAWPEPGRSGEVDTKAELAGDRRLVLASGRTHSTPRVPWRESVNGV